MRKLFKWIFNFASNRLPSFTREDWFHQFIHEDYAKNTNAQQI
jgi:hypothetical protein